MNKFDALEIILQQIFENNAALEDALAEFPQWADELRPLVDAALSARVEPVDVPDAAMRRGRARVLQHAAEMREAPQAPRVPRFDLRRAAVALMLALVFFISGTGLVQASANALPGDRLYAVKRGWESARYVFASREEVSRLDTQFQQERLSEVRELLVQSRSEAVDFVGEVIRQDGSRWNVAGVTVDVALITPLDDSIQPGTEISVRGQTESDGVVLASSVTLLNETPVVVENTPTLARQTDEPDEKNDLELPIVETPGPDEVDDAESTPTLDAGDEANADDEAIGTPSPGLPDDDDDEPDVIKTPEPTDEPDDD